MSQKTEECKPLVVVRIRGTVSAQREARETLDSAPLKPHKPRSTNRQPTSLQRHAATHKQLRHLRRTHKRNRCHDDPETRALSRRQKTNRRIPHKNGYKSIDDLAEAIVSCKVQYGKLPDIQARFRLHPPSKGYKGKTKKGFKAGGEAGYRGEAINALVQRMV